MVMKASVFRGPSSRKPWKNKLMSQYIQGSGSLSLNAAKALADDRISIDDPTQRRDIDRIAGIIDDGQPLESDLVKHLIKLAGFKDYDYRRIPMSDRRRMAMEVMNESKQERDSSERHWKHLYDWAAGDLKIESPKGSSLHHLMRYHAEARKTKGKEPHSLAKLTADWHDFVVEQNWAALFPTDLADKDAPWKLPFEKTVMEFRIQGVRVLAFMEQAEGSEKIICNLLALGIEKQWYSAPLIWEVESGQIRWLQSERLTDDFEEGDLVFNRVFDLVCIQARSIAIMLDAEVVTRDAVEPSSGLVKKARREGKSPPERYHIISLKARFRSKERSEATGRHLEGWHWRRGHWRHYEGNVGQIKYLSDDGYPRSKTWIKWQTIGDTTGPFRGGKEYRA